MILGLWIKHGDRVRALNYDFGLNFGSPYICLDKFYITPKITIHLNNFVKNNNISLNLSKPFCDSKISSLSSF